MLLSTVHDVGQTAQQTAPAWAAVAHVDDVTSVRVSVYGRPPEWIPAYTVAGAAAMFNCSPRRVRQVVRERFDRFKGLVLVSPQTSRGQFNFPLEVEGLGTGNTLYLLAPALLCLAQSLDRNAVADQVQDWLAERGWALLVDGVATASPAASPIEALEACHALLGGAIAQLKQHGHQLGDHETRLTGVEQAIEALRAGTRVGKRRGGPTKRVRQQLAHDFVDHGCVICGSGRDFVVGHVKAHTDGGSLAITNLMPCCRPCNENRTAADRELRASHAESYSSDPRPRSMRLRYERMARDWADPPSRGTSAKTGKSIAIPVEPGQIRAFPEHPAEESAA